MNTMAPRSVSWLPWSYRLVLIVALCLGLSGLATTIQPAQAAPILYVAPDIGTTTDCSQINPCSLAQAFAMITGDGFTIILAPGTYTGYNTISHGLTMQGPAVSPGMDPLVILDGTIDATHANRVINIQLNNKATVNLMFLTLQHGHPASESGGGIRCINATLYLNGVVVRQNTSPVDGGGVFTSSGCDLSIVNSRIEANTAASYGGGIGASFNSQPVVILDSVVIQGNAANGGGGGLFVADTTGATLTRVAIRGNSAPRGGGFFAGAETAHPLTLVDASVTGNSADVGGGIYSYRTTNLTNVTLSDNQATNYGGALYGDASSATYWANLILNHVTLANNRITGSGSSFDGTGVYLNSGGGGNAQAFARNSILAGPGGKAVCAGPSSSHFTSQDHNINTDASCHLNSFPVNGDRANTDPLLEPLQDNGGSTLTHALLPGSPAINAASLSVTTHDQRGFAYNGTPDIGAFESLLPPEILVYAQVAPPFRVGEQTELYISLQNPNMSPSRHSNLSFTLTLPDQLVWGNPVSTGSAPVCGAMIQAGPGGRTLEFAGGTNGLTAPDTDCRIVMNVKGVQAGSGQVTTSGVASLEAGTGPSAEPLLFIVDEGTTYLPMIVH